uniref:RNA helicase n=1 Tax=Micromonas pusilla TaxID=38833 RepID=A0A7S0I880_MICPS|mmetsp:Transcript_11537/g.48300  ORF Transcript_11537/g.48300 Transcript_11537/m.48300 type:complete len:1093 (+) Transcript_11537:56-3334(+)
MDERALKSWVSDKLHDILGFAEGALASYVIALGKKASDAGSLASQLASQGLPDDGTTRSFAAELMSRVPRAGGGPSAYKRDEREAADVAARNRSYAMLDDEEDDHVPAPAAKEKGGSSKDEKRRERRLRKAGGDDSDEDEEAIAARKRARETTGRGRRWEEGEGGDEEDEEAREQRLREEEMERDLKEKEEFEERLRRRDDEKTRKLTERKLTLEEQMELERRGLNKTEEERNAMIPELRNFSRQEYLKKREVQKLEELKGMIEDEEYLFDGVELTEQEVEDQEYRKKIYKLAMEQVRNVDEILDDRYKMPDSYDEGGKQGADKRFEALTTRYRDTQDADDTNPFKEQEEWESHQITMSKAQFGALDKKPAGKQYDYVFEDQIGFIKDEVMGGVGDVSSSSSDDETDDEDGNRVKKVKQRQKSARELAEAKKAEEALSAKEAMAKDRASLPIYPYREDLIQAVEDHQVVVIVGETGSGKTTQIPQYMWEAGFAKGDSKIGCTQPRRVAAMSVSARVANEAGVKLGNEVGYSIRFEDCTSEKTKLKYMTDGMLLREFLGEPDLASYSVMMVDEAHERTLHTDVLFGLVKDIARFRPDIKLLISSATLDAEKFSEYFDFAPIFRIPGRRYPVDIMYTKQPEADYLDAAIVTVLQIHVTQPPGDILLFCTGQEEIETAEEILKQRMRSMGSKVPELAVAPIYASLPSDLQAKIFEPPPEGGRKVVLATNIAETSLTIDGIKYVIDPGFCKQKSYNPRTGMESLMVTPTSQASALQRAGRAGRTSAGKCFRLYTAWSFQNELDPNTVPEIQRTNLGNVVLMLKSLGINDLMHFDFMDAPPAETLLRALEQLYALGALNDRGELTKLGRRMAEFPLDPMLSKTLVASDKYKCSEEVATICCMLSSGNTIFYRPKDKIQLADHAHQAFHIGNVGDHLALLNVYNQWADTNYSTQWCYENFVQVRSMKRARDIRDQLLGLLERVEIDLVSDRNALDSIKKCITAGFFYHTAKLQKNGSYRTVKNPQTVSIHPSSGLAKELPRWVVYFELVFTTKEYMRQVIEIDPKWLMEIAPHYYKEKEIEEGMMKMPKAVGKAAGAD